MKQFTKGLQEYVIDGDFDLHDLDNFCDSLKEKGSFYLFMDCDTEKSVREAMVILINSPMSSNVKIEQLTSERVSSVQFREFNLLIIHLEILDHHDLFNMTGILDKTIFIATKEQLPSFIVKIIQLEAVLNNTLV